MGEGWVSRGLLNNDRHIRSDVTVIIVILIAVVASSDPEKEKNESGTLCSTHQHATMINVMNFFESAFLKTFNIRKDNYCHMAYVSICCRAFGASDKRREIITIKKDIRWILFFARATASGLNRLEIN